MKKLVKSNWEIVFIYAVIMAVISFFLLNYEKVQIHIYMNQVVGNKLIDNFFYYITYLGDGLIAPVILLMILFYNVRLGICATISFITAALFTNAIKYFVFDDIMRPWFVFQHFVDFAKLKYVDTKDLHIHNSLPSGHATQAFAIFMCLALFAKNRLNKFLFLSIALIAAFSRVYLSQHWLVDITAGSFIGTVTAFILFYFIDSGNRLEKLNRPLIKVIRSE